MDYNKPKFTETREERRAARKVYSPQDPMSPTEFTDEREQLIKSEQRINKLSTWFTPVKGGVELYRSARRLGLPVPVSMFLAGELTMLHAMGYGGGAAGLFYTLHNKI